MPNRVEKQRPDAFDKTPPEPRLRGFREAVMAELGIRGWKVADLVRATKIDDGYMRRMLIKGERFNEENIVQISDVLNLPVYIGEVARPVINVEAPPAPGSTKKKGRPENVPIPVLPASIVVQKPFRYDPWKVNDWAYINRRAFQAFRIESMACVKLLMETEEPLVRKEALICICTDVKPPPKEVPSGSVWAARKGEDLVIGRLDEKENAVLLVQKIPVNKVEVIGGRDDIVGRVCWVWHSMV